MKNIKLFDQFLNEAKGSLSSPVEKWLRTQIDAHDAYDTGINGEFELGISKQYYGYDPIAVKLMREMKKLGEVWINIKDNDIGDVKITFLKHGTVIAKWGKLNVRDRQTDFITASNEPVNEGFLAVVGGIVIGGMVLSAITKLALGALKNKEFDARRLHNVLNDASDEIIKQTGVDKAGVKTFEDTVKSPLQKQIDSGEIKNIRELESRMSELVEKLVK